MSASDFPPIVRQATRFRADGKCEWCQVPTQHPDLHHRLYRSRGGTGNGSNAVALCRPCHGLAHGLEPASEASAAAAGITLPTGSDPAMIPIYSHTFSLWIYLLENGDFTFAAPNDSQSYQQGETR